MFRQRRRIATVHRVASTTVAAMAIGQVVVDLENALLQKSLEKRGVW